MFQAGATSADADMKLWCATDGLDTMRRCDVISALHCCCVWLYMTQIEVLRCRAYAFENLTM